MISKCQDNSFVPYTGNTSIFAILSIKGAIAGYDKTGPIIGKLLKKVMIILKKSPNNNSMPNNSTLNPMKGFLKNTIIVIPITKQRKPLIFDLCKKNPSVLDGPISNVIPSRNTIFPSERSLWLKKERIPRRKNTDPAAVKAAPNSNIQKKC